MQILEGYIYLGNTSLLGNEVATAFTATLDAEFRATLKDQMIALPEFEDKAKGLVTPQEMIKLLPQHHFIACLQLVSSRLTINSRLAS